MNSLDEHTLNDGYDVKYKKMYAVGAKGYEKSRFGSMKGLYSKEAKNEVILAILRTRDLMSKHTRIIDLASGTGRIAHEVVKAGFSNVYSADITIEMLGLNKRNLLPQYRGQLTWVVADIKKLPFVDSSFDVATLGSFFYLIPQERYEHYLKDIYRILRPKGLLICEVSNALHVANPWSLARIMHRKHWEKKSIKSYVYPWSIKRLFQGFMVEKIVGVDYPLLVRNRAFHKRVCSILGIFPITKFFGGKFVVVLKRE